MHNLFKPQHIYWTQSQSPSKNNFSLLNSNFSILCDIARPQFVDGGGGRGGGRRGGRGGGGIQIISVAANVFIWNLVCYKSLIRQVHWKQQQGNQYNSYRLWGYQRSLRGFLHLHGAESLIIPESLSCSIIFQYFNCCVRNSLPPIPIASQTNPVHVIPFHFFNTILILSCDRLGVDFSTQIIVSRGQTFRQLRG